MITQRPGVFEREGLRSTEKRLDDSERFPVLMAAPRHRRQRDGQSVDRSGKEHLPPSAECGQDATCRDILLRSALIPPLAAQDEQSERWFRRLMDENAASVSAPR